MHNKKYNRYKAFYKIMIEIIIFFLLGILAGTIAGLLPGIHTNLVSALLLPLFFSIQNPVSAIIFITSMALTNTFIDFIPSIYLSAPDEDTALGVMPGHKFLLRGYAHQAVLLTLIGSSLAVIISLIITPLFILIIPKIYSFINRMLSFLLIWISIFLLSKEKQKIMAAIIFILAGFLGLASLNIPINQPLLPLLTGLFGSSALICSIKQKTKIPEQKISRISIDKKQILKPAFLTAIISPLCSFFPGLGSSQAAIIASSISKLSRKQFLILLGSINTVVISVSFITLFLINKSRTGAAAAIQQIIQLTSAHVIYIIITIILASAVSIPLTIFLSKFFAKNINKMSYTAISIIILIFLTIITIIFSGFLGLLIFITATALGLVAIFTQIRRTNLMGSLLIPTIIIYLPI